MEEAYSYRVGAYCHYDGTEAHFFVIPIKYCTLEFERNPFDPRYLEFRPFTLSIQEVPAPDTSKPSYGVFIFYRETDNVRLLAHVDTMAQAKKLFKREYKALLERTKRNVKFYLNHDPVGPVQ